MPSTSVDHINVNKKVSSTNAKHIDPTIGARESREDGSLSLNTWGFAEAIYLVISPSYSSKAMG
jgi:hypothetical protein